MRSALLAFLVTIVGSSALALGTAALIAQPGCNPSVESPAEQLGFCILGAAGSDVVEAISDPASLIPVIIAACSKYGVVTVDAIIATIEAYFSNAPTMPDAAVGANVHEARLRKVLAAALTIAGVKGTEAGGQ